MRSVVRASPFPARPRHDQNSAAFPVLAVLSRTRFYAVLSTLNAQKQQKAGAYARHGWRDGDVLGTRRCQRLPFPLNAETGSARIYISASSDVIRLDELICTTYTRAQRSFVLALLNASKMSLSHLQGNVRSQRSHLG